MNRIISSISCLLFLSLDGGIHAFAPTSGCTAFACQRSASSSLSSLYSSEVAAAVTTDSQDDSALQIDPKEAVKLFGRLAEKYIMLDASAGMCCYSACSDCEFREPGGGYRMADQSSARPKWIPCYERREFKSQGKEHTTKWSSIIFDGVLFVTKDEFIEKLKQMEFVPPLGGPYLAASAAAIDDDTAAAALFDVLAGEKEKLTRHRMGTEMKGLANGEEGITWAMFSAALGVK